jgi:hypothetical protein
MSQSYEINLNNALFIVNYFVTSLTYSYLCTQSITYNQKKNKWNWP